MYNNVGATKWTNLNLGKKEVKAWSFTITIGKSIMVNHN